MKQSILPLKSGPGALKLTTAKYVRPSGKNMHRDAQAKEADPWGVTPNDGLVVKFSDEELKQFRQHRQQREGRGDDQPDADFSVTSPLLRKSCCSCFFDLNRPSSLTSCFHSRCNEPGIRPPSNSESLRVSTTCSLSEVKDFFSESNSSKRSA